MDELSRALLCAISLFKKALIFLVNPIRYVCCSGEQYPNSGQRYNMLRTSAQLPFAMFKNLMFVVSEPDSLPSAILFMIETDARCIWSRKPKSRISLIIRYTDIVNVLASCQTSNSSKYAMSYQHINVSTYQQDHRSMFAYVALRSINSRRGGTSSPMSIEKMRSAEAAFSMVTWRSWRFSGSMVVSRSWSGFISPRPL